MKVIKAWRVSMHNDMRIVFNEYLDEIFEEGVISNGKLCRKLEDVVKTIHEKKYCIATSSGTSAIECLLQYYRDILGFDTVCVQGVGFISDWIIPERLGMRIIPVDIRKDLIIMDVDDLIKAIKENEVKKTVVMPVWLFGWYSREYEKMIIDELTDKGIEFRILNDVAHCFGSAQKLCGDGILSFASTKIVAAGEGGAIMTDDEEIDEWCRIAIDIGRIGKMCHVVGNNWKLSEFNAGFALSQLRYYNSDTVKRKRVFDTYKKLINEEDLYVYDPSRENSNWTYNYYECPVISRKILRHIFEEELMCGHNIEAWYSSVRYAVNEEEVWERLKNKVERNIDNANWITKHVVCLPMHVGMDIKDAKRVADAVLKIYKKWW